MNIIEEISNYAKENHLDNQFEIAAYYNVITQDPFKNLFKHPRLFVSDTFAMINFQETNEHNTYHGSSVSFKHDFFSNDPNYNIEYTTEYHRNNLKGLYELISNNDLTTVNQELNKHPELFFSFYVYLQEREKPFFQLTKKITSEYYAVQNQVYGHSFLTLFKDTFIESINEYPLSYKDLFVDESQGVIPTDFFLTIKKDSIENPIALFKEKYNNDVLNKLTDKSTELHVFLNNAFDLIKKDILFRISAEYNSLQSIETLSEGYKEHIQKITDKINKKMDQNFVVEHRISTSLYSSKEMDYLAQNALKFSDVKEENDSMNSLRYSKYFNNDNSKFEYATISLKSTNDIIASACIIRNQDLSNKMSLNAIELSHFVVDKMYDQEKYFKNLVEQVIHCANAEQKVLFISAPLNTKFIHMAEEVINSPRFIEPLVIIEPQGQGDREKAIQIEYVKAFKELLTSANHSFSLQKSKRIYKEGLDYINQHKENVIDFEKLASDAIKNIKNTPTKKQKI